MKTERGLKFTQWCLSSTGIWQAKAGSLEFFVVEWPGRKFFVVMANPFNKPEHDPLPSYELAVEYANAKAFEALTEMANSLGVTINED